MLALISASGIGEEEKSFFTRLYQKNEKVMFFIANGILRSQARAEEAVQDAFVKAIEHLGELMRKSEDECRAWLIVVVKHIAINVVKRDSVIQYYGSQEYLKNEDIEFNGDFTSENNYEWLIEAIQELPQVYRNIIYLRFVCEFSYSEIAKELGISEKSIGIRLRRGREILMQKLKQEENISDDSGV